MSTDQNKCEDLVDQLRYAQDQEVYTYETTIFDNQTARLVAKTTDGKVKKVVLRLPGLRAALKSHAQHGFGHQLERDGVRWEFKQGYPMKSHFSSSSSDSTDNAVDERQKES